MVFCSNNRGKCLEGNELCNFLSLYCSTSAGTSQSPWTLSGVLFLRVIFLGGLLYCCCHAGCATLLFHIRTEVLSCVQLSLGLLARRCWATRAVLLRPRALGHPAPGGQSCRSPGGGYVWVIPEMTSAREAFVFSFTFVF